MPNRKKLARPSPGRNAPPNASTSPAEFEAEVLPGLKPTAINELRRQLGQQLWLFESDRPDQIRFAYLGDLDKLRQLRQSVAVYQILHFAIPRPSALLGHQHFTRLLGQVEVIRRRFPADTFRTFRISAAGKDSSVFSRLIEAIGEQTDLQYDDDEGDFFLRVRPATGDRPGWEVLLRLSPRPLSVRPWRVEDMAGALNATVASALIELTQPRHDDRFLNLMCGSGTLLIERLQRGPVQAAFGGDLDTTALASARRNITAAHLTKQISLLQLDGCRSPLPTATFDVICADLPWGQLIGSHADNASLYPALLAEAARLAAPGVRLVLLTHEIKLMERLLKEKTHEWVLKDAVQVFQGGLRPKIYLLVRQ